MNRLSTAVVAVVATLAFGCHKKHEHAGSTASGATKEHGGKEHAGKEHGGTPAPAKTFTAEDIKAAMNAHIAAETKKGNGVLMIQDEKTKEALQLEFVKIHDPVRVIEGKGYFACTDFRPKGADADKLYDLDFWLKPDASGNLAVYDTKIHKHPEKGADGKWAKKERYTFINDNPVEVK